MKNVPENELFSAYLDGELTAAEQAEMEQLLAGSPEARQLMDEFRALSATLQSLPAHQVGEGLSAQVLRAAERRMLGEPAGPEAHQATVQPEAFSWRRTLGRMARPRNLLWPAAAAAAGLLLFYVNPGRQEPGPGGPAGDRPVAMKDAAAPRSDPPAPREAAASRVDKADARAMAVRAPDAKAASLAAKADKMEAETAREPGPAVFPLPAAPSPSSLTARGGGGSESPVARKMKDGSAAPPAEENGKGPGPGGFAAKGADEGLIVRCDVTSDALAAGVLEQILDRLQITDKRDVTRQQAEQRDPALWRYVEAQATPAQIEAALKELQSQPARFLAVSRPQSGPGGGPAMDQTAQRAMPMKGVVGPQAARLKAPATSAAPPAKQAESGPTGVVMAAPPTAQFQVQSSSNQAASGRAASGLAADPSQTAPSATAAQGMGPGSKLQVLPGGAPYASVQIPPPVPRKLPIAEKQAVQAAPDATARRQVPETARQRVLFVLQVRAGQTDGTAKAAARVSPEASKAAAKAPPRPSVTAPGK